MKVLIEIPKEFEEHFNNDRFKDSLERVRADIQYHGYPLSGLYELELIQMLQNAMAKAVEKWQSLKHWQKIELKIIHTD